MPSSTLERAGLRTRWLRLLMMVGLLAAHPPARAGAPPRESLNERLFGPTRIHGAVGNGRVTAAVSHRGEVTVLRWPGPSLFDQLAYHTRPGSTSRSLPLFGARPDQGIFAGISYRLGAQRNFRWLRDEPARHDLTYRRYDSGVLVDRVTGIGDGISVEMAFACPPGLDALVIRHTVSVAPDSPATGVHLVMFEHLSPTHTRWPYVPLYDTWIEDPDLLRYDRAAGALVHRRALRLFERGPEGAAATADEELASRDIDPDGPVVEIGGDRRPLAVQCGPASRLHARKDDAYYDAMAGELSGTPFHEGHSTGALAFELDTGRTGVDSVTTMFAFGHTDRDAAAVLARARAAGAARLLDDTDRYWAELIAGARLPRGVDARERAVLSRALITIHQNVDPASGAIVASISTQPPYAQDWPRDGAFLNLVLDLAGFPDVVTRHQRFYMRVQRQKDRFLAVRRLAQPRGTFDMNYYSDGAPGGPFVFEIDNTGMAAWSYAEHGRYLRASQGEAAAATYLREIYPGLSAAADALVSWRDPATGLPAPAYEDDDPRMQQGLQGAGAVLLGLRSAARVAGDLGHERDQQRWSARALEVAAAILAHRYDPTNGFSKAQGDGPVGWLVWPVGLLPSTDPRMVFEADGLWDRLRARLAGAPEGGSYEPKVLMALLLTRGQDAAWRPRLEWAYRQLVDALPTPGTLHYGETYVPVHGASGVLFENQTAIPHAWAASLVYLASMLVHEGAIEPAGARP